MRLVTAFLLVAVGISLSGCALLFDAAALEGAEIGMGMGAALPEAEVAAGARVFATSELMGDAAISDELTPLARDVRLSPQMAGDLSRALRMWTADGTRIGRMMIARDGSIGADGYVFARIDAHGVLNASNGLRLGFFNAHDGFLYEYLKTGAARPIGVLRGFTGDAPVHLARTAEGGTSVRILEARSAVDVVGVSQGRYLLRLVDGSRVWAARGSLASLMLLGVGQNHRECPVGASGTAVLRSGVAFRYEACVHTPTGYGLSQNGAYRGLTAGEVAYFMTGDGLDDRQRPRYVIAYNGRTIYDVPPSEAFSQHPSEGREAHSPWPTYKGQ